MTDDDDQIKGVSSIASESISSATSKFEGLSDELGNLLQRLSGINDELNDWVNSGGIEPSSVAVQHTLQRHRDVLQDYRHEFNKTRSNVANIIERHDLLDSVRRDINDYQRNNMPGNQSDQKGKNGAPK